MIETVTSTMIDRLAAIYVLMDARNDSIHRDRVRDLIRKCHDREFALAFCGHFSAGKSTLLNRLYGEELLPTSPIPTSANVVKVRKGEDQVILTLASGERQVVPMTDSDQDIQQLCKSGADITAVEISRRQTPFPEGVALLDTPGVDSTDAIHESATESALHLADVIFFVMDYNHVQSEGNITFVKRLKDRNKRVFLVINQVDKHRDEELSFGRYLQRVKETFSQWGVEVDGLYCTSLKEPDHPHNQLNKLEEKIQELVDRRNALLDESLEQEAIYLIGEHQRVLDERTQASMEEIMEQLGEELPQKEKIEQEILQWNEVSDRLTHELMDKRSDFQKGLDEILRNAYLMPYENREVAHRYLETELTRFRVGWFFSKGKTEKAKEERLQAFLATLRKTVDTQLDFHLKQYLVDFLQAEDLYTEERGEAIYSLNVSIRPDLLKEVIKEGAGLTGDYLLKYTEDLGDRIKQEYRRQAHEWFASVLPLFQERMEVRQKEAKAQLTRLNAMLEATNQMEQLQKKQQEAIEELTGILEGKRELHPPDLEAILKEEETVTIKENPDDAMIPFSSTKMKIDEGGSSDSLSQPSSSANRMEEQLRSIQKAEEVMQPVKALHSVRKELLEKRKRVENRRFTVALFGAFSAGKSSFANALLGEKLLPVSPNPTTAAINRISAPHGAYRHGDVVVRLKSEEIVLEELQKVFRRFGRQVTSLQSAIQQIGELLEISDPDPMQKMAFPFLRAVREGYPAVSSLLGSVRTVLLSEFHTYVANESLSCFVELAELYVDTPLTRRGITLVDTPGADSIHARHTEVAFRYIREADAILYVTYYNHAFSRADREFLIQLGRVKDAFSMDKMFFIMNAADLASSADECHDVMSYLKDQLQQYGIRNPRMFAVSSLMALQQDADHRLPPEGSGVGAFQEAFTEFLDGDLMSVSLQGMKEDLKRSCNILKRLTQEACQGNEEKQAKIRAYQQEKEQIVQRLSDLDSRSDAYALRQEIEELFYYIKQRLFLRYQDVFIEIFNPSVLSGDRRKAKERLKSCIREMIRFIQQDLLQELRATSLRVERWIVNRLDGWMQSVQKDCHQVNESLPFSEDLEMKLPAPEWSEPFPTLEPDAFKTAIATFKNSRDFFEKNGKQKMRGEVKMVLEHAVESYLRETLPLCLSHYEQEWQKTVQQMKEKMILEATTYYTDMIDGLSEQTDPSLYEQTMDELMSIIQEMDASGVSS